MKKILFFLTLLATASVAPASELTSVDQPEVVDTKQSAILKGVGIPSSFKTQKRVFLRNGTKVAALLVVTSSINNGTPTVRRFIQFYINGDNWVEINLADTRFVTVHFDTEATLIVTIDSITVTAPKTGYCEIFFKSTGKFLDGTKRDQILSSNLKQTMEPL